MDKNEEHNSLGSQKPEIDNRNKSLPPLPTTSQANEHPSILKPSTIVPATPSNPTEGATTVTMRHGGVHVPHAHVPRVHVPDIHVPHVHVPDVHVPHVHVPDVHVPHVHVPDAVSKKNIADTKIVGLKDVATSLDRRQKFLAASAALPPVPRSNASGDGRIAMVVDNVEEKEAAVRANKLKNPFLLLLLGNLAALKVMAIFLISLETLVTCAVTAGLTVYWYDYGLAHEDWNGGAMSYIILAFALTSPVAAAISMAFNRREAALANIADFRSFAHQLYLAHSLWDWPDQNGGSGRANVTNVSLREHCDGVMAQIVGIGDELSRFLTLPATSRSRHRMTRQGRREAARTIDVAYKLLESMTTQRMTLLSIYAERMKLLGLNSGELSRIRQYERFIESLIEKLRMTKMYRTPQGLRSFARIFTWLLPPFYAPTFAQTALETHSLGVGIAFGLLTAIGLTALFESLQVLEDPFTAYLALDGIDVREEFEVLLWSSLVNTRKLVFPDAPRFPSNRRAALVAERGDRHLSTVASKSTRRFSQMIHPMPIPENDYNSDDPTESTTPETAFIEDKADPEEEAIEFGTPLEEDIADGDINPVRQSQFTTDAGASIALNRHRRARSGSVVWTSEG